MPNYDQAYFTRRDALVAAGIDPDDRTLSDTVFGTEYVYCHAHCRAHTTGWCTVGLSDKTPLAGTTDSEATDEARDRGFWIYGESRPCINGCGTELDMNGRPVGAAFEENVTCSSAPQGRGSSQAHKIR